MKHYKTLEGLSRNLFKNHAGQVSACAMQTGVYYGTKFRIPESEEDRFWAGLAGVVWSKATPARAGALRRVRDSLMDRLWFDGHGFVYCGAQDCAGELRYIQGLARKFIY